MMFNRQTSLWMGDLDPYMDEDFIKQAFSAMGESPLGVKIITHRITGGSAGYCFVELADEESVERCVQRLNGKLVPGSNPPRKFKLNYATYGKRPEPGPEFSVFVGDLASEVDDYQLHQAFKKYPSCKGAKVVTDQYGYSRGYGFVKFGDENEQKKAIEECQGTMLAGKPLRLSIAVAKSQKVGTFQGQNTYTNYSQTPTSYYGSTGGTGGYYPQWGSYDQYSGYGSGYNASYPPGYGPGYSYNYGPYGYPPPGHMMPPPPVGGPSAPTDTTAATDQSQEATNPAAVESTEEPLGVCDVDQWNKDFMQRKNLLKYVTTMVCVAVDGKPVIGVIHQPFNDFTAWALVGHDSNVQARSSYSVTPPKVIISRSHPGEAKNYVQEAFGNSTTAIQAGGAGYKVLSLLDLPAGESMDQADIYVHITAIKKWDICAGDALLRALGGHMTTLKGEEIDYRDTPLNSGGLVATVGLDHKAVLEKLPAWDPEKHRHTH